MANNIESILSSPYASFTEDTNINPSMLAWVYLLVRYTQEFQAHYSPKCCIEYADILFRERTLLALRKEMLRGLDMPISLYTAPSHLLTRGS